LRNVLSMRSVRLCQKIIFFISYFFACFLNSPYLRFLRSASVYFFVPFLVTMISWVHAKNALTNFSSSAFPFLVWWLQCIKNRFCKLYFFSIKKLYTKHAVNILSAPPLTAIISFSLGHTLFFNTSKYICLWVDVSEMFFISFIVPVFSHVFFINIRFEIFQ